MIASLRGLLIAITDRRRLLTILCIFGNAVLLTDSLNLLRTCLIEEATERRESSERVDVVMSSGGSISWNVFAIDPFGGGVGGLSSRAVIYLIRILRRFCVYCANLLGEE